MSEDEAAAKLVSLYLSNPDKVQRILSKANIIGGTW